MNDRAVPRPSFQLAALANRVRQSLFAIPGLALLVAVVAAEIMIRLDRSNTLSSLPDAYETSAENARAVLSAVATGMITVVTLVLTLTLVAIQLSAGQLSPRTIVNFLGDRFQQATVGVVLGTAAYSLLALRALRVDGDGTVGNPPDLTVLVAVLATVASLLMLIVSVDRTANRLAVGTLVTDVAEETCALVERLFGGDPGVAGGSPGVLVSPPPATAAFDPRVVLESDRSGWVQSINEDELLSTLPEGAGIRLLHPVGTFVLTGVELAEVDAENLGDDARRALRSAIVIGDSRTMQSDVAFGLTRLNDIALRALSPGINDTNTAREVALRIGQVVLALQAQELWPEDDEVDGHRVVRRGSPTHDAFVETAFDQIRRAGWDNVEMLSTIGRTLQVVEAETERRGLPGGLDEVRRQLVLVQDRLADLLADTAGGSRNAGRSADGGDGPPTLP